LDKKKGGQPPTKGRANCNWTDPAQKKGGDGGNCDRWEKNRASIEHVQRESRDIQLKGQRSEKSGRQGEQNAKNVQKEEGERKNFETRVVRREKKGVKNFGKKAAFLRSGKGV